MCKFSEKELQNLIIDQVHNNTFIPSIAGVEDLKHVVSVDYGDRYLPRYWIDSQLRYKYAKSALCVLESLNESQLITGNKIQNISIQKDQTRRTERLYPDVVLGNPRLSTFTIMELKGGSQTEREAISELLAYTSELKNHLPHIADQDINLVVISTEFDALLDHSLASLLFSSKFNLLALKVNKLANNLSIRVHIPSAWTDIWENSLPPETFSSLTLIVEKEGDEAPNPDITDTAFYEILEDSIMFEAARHNSHGFYILWNDMRKNIHTRFGITLCQINPMVFLQSSVDAGFKLNAGEPLSRYVLSNKECNVIGSLHKLAKVAEDLLSRYYSVHYDSLSSWSSHMSPGSEFRTNALPFGFNSWGNIGEFLRSNYYHPALLDKEEIQSINMGLFKYKDPAYGIETINLISGLTLFDDGVFDAGSLYKFAKQLSVYHLIASTFYQAKQTGLYYSDLKPSLFFSALDVLSSCREVQYRINSCTTNLPPSQKLKIWLYDVDENPYHNILSYKKWFIEFFLRNEPFYQNLFANFCVWGILYSKVEFVCYDREFKATVEEGLVQFVRDHLREVLEKLYFKKTIFYNNDVSKVLSSGYFHGNIPIIASTGDIEKAISKIDDSTILNTFETVFIDLLNLTVPQVFHDLTPSDFGYLKEVDWVGLRLRLIERYKEGERFGGIFVSPNGSVSTGILKKELQYDFLKISDPEKEVILLNDSSGMRTIRKVSWDDIMDGTVQI